MVRFIKNCILFAFISVFATVSIVIGLNALIEKDGYYSVDPAIKGLILGDSHSECALNDSLIVGLRNFAQSGESYFYTYLKTKKIVSHNPQIKVVFIEFNNGQIISNMDNCIWDSEHLSNKFPKYAIALSVSDYYLLFRKNLEELINAQAVTIRESFSLLFKEDRTAFDANWGEYKNLTNDATEKLDLLENISLTQDTSLIKTSSANISYLEKTIALCHSLNIKVFLVRSPVHKKYKGSLNELSFKKVYNEHFSEEEFLDFKDFPIDNSQFADIHHLNFHGATKFSHFFNDLIEGGLLNNDEKQKVIDAQIKILETQAD